MGRPELGTKCTCTGCHERFYDLNRSPAVCPKCGAEQPPEKPRVLRQARAPFGSRMQAQPAPVAVDDDVGSAEASDVEDDDDEGVPEADDDTDDDDVEITPDRAKPID